MNYSPTPDCATPVAYVSEPEARRTVTLVFLVFGSDTLYVDDTELLTTGQVAGLFGCSRQHVVDLCTSGRLPFEVIGTHRRVRRVEVERFLGRSLLRDQERSLWLHHAVAAHVVANPDAVLDLTGQRLADLRRQHAGKVVVESLVDWQNIVAAGAAQVLEALTSREGWAVELRQNSPFAGVLSEGERQVVLSSFQRDWRRRHAA